MRRRTGRAAALAVLCGWVTLVAGCAGGPAPADAAAGDPLEDTLVVLAAASLTDAVTTLAARLESAHPGLDVRTTFGPSSTLAAQVVAGAPADVLLTASRETMTTAEQAVGGDPVVVAANRLELAVPAGNPGDVTSVADLADPDLTIALCAPEVPCGALASQVLARAGVVASPDTLERDVRAVLTRLRLDEADAGLVYRTDVVAAAGDVEAVELPADLHLPTEHLALGLPDAPHPAAARAFLSLLQGPTGREVLTDAGFDVP